MLEGQLVSRHHGVCLHKSLVQVHLIIVEMAVMDQMGLDLDGA